MYVKIVSNGEPGGTRIYGAAGENLSAHCTAVTWTHAAGEIPSAEVRLGLVDFEVEGEARLVGPNGKAVRRIEYEDGEAVDFEPTPRAPAPADLMVCSDNRVRKVG